MAKRAVNYSSFLTLTAKSRSPSAIRAIAPLARLPGMISMAAGLPNPSSFPFETLSFSLKDGQQIPLDDKLLNEGLQYSLTEGVPMFVSQLKSLMQRYHNPPSKYEMLVTTGSQHAFAMACDMLLSRHDSILVENPTYSGALAYLRPMGLNIVGIKTDEHGLDTDDLQRQLEAGITPRPKVLYTIPTGQNPSGATMSLERRKKLLQLASDHDFLIFEDDPYYFLQFGDFVPSLFSLDTEGRVIRFDSLSKVLSSGMRLGWMSGPPPLVERANLHQQSASLHTSAIAQVLAAAVFDKWGVEGWNQHVDKTRTLYRGRKTIFEGLANRLLGDRVSFSPPSAGMFFWLRLKGIDNSTALIEQKAREKGVLMVPGQVFSPDDSPSSYVRASFSTASPQDMEQGLTRLAQLLDSQ